MGQKIHPLGFRVGITKSHQSQWFARFHKRKYAQTVLEDRVLRETLLKLFPELLNPVLKKAQKREGTVEVSPKMTHIKIERGLIPYEIGIQIHAGNCEFIKSAIDQLEVDQNLVHNLQKTRRYLFDLKDKFKNSSITNSNQSLGSQSNSGRSTVSSLVQQSRLASQKNFKRRQNSRFKFRKSLFENMMILKKGKKLKRTVQKKFYSLISTSLKNSSKFQKNSGVRSNSSNFDRRSKQGQAAGGQNRLTSRSRGKNSFTPQRGAQGGMRSKSFSRQNRDSFLANKKQKNQGVKRVYSSALMSSVGSGKTKAFIDTYVSKMSRKFVRTFKAQMNDWNRFLKAHRQDQIQKYGKLRFAPLGYQRKWSLSRLSRLQNQPFALLVQLLRSLQKKALKKMEFLQKEFSALGTISKMESFNYYQMIRFIKSLKQLVKQMKIDQNSQKNNSRRFDSNLQNIQKFEKSLLNFTETALRKKLNNIEDECRKIKFIDYLELLVKKHRQKNVYLYLSTIADSRKYLKKIQQFTKQQANFLFGVDLKTIQQYPIEKQREFLTNKVAKAYREANRKNSLEKNVQDVFLEQMQKQRNYTYKNIELTPKISIKFFNVKATNLETNASLVADQIADDLEKRKAFRGVIKKAKDKLMANSKVKGVKILASGRLNGAEIARSEWVRAGRVPLQTLRANIDYCYKTANTIYGIIGIKIWIYKGYTQNLSSKQNRKSNLNSF
jgi:ribosomal protein S3